MFRMSKKHSICGDIFDRGNGKCHHQYVNYQECLLTLLESFRFKIEFGLHERRFAKSGLPGENSLSLFCVG